MSSLFSLHFISFFSFFRLLGFINRIPKKQNDEDNRKMKPSKGNVQRQERVTLRGRWSSNTSCHHLLDHNFLEDIAKDRKVIPDPIDDRFFISISNGHENIGFFKSWKFEAIDIFS